MSFPSYHDYIGKLEAELIESGSLGLLVLDASHLSDIEDEYGTSAYQEVRQRLFKGLLAAQGKEFRQADILCLDRPRGVRFLFFLDRKRRRSLSITITDLRLAYGRLVAALPKLAESGRPYVKTPRFEVGYGLALHNPLLHVERIIERAIEDALLQAAKLKGADEQRSLERIQDIVLRERVRTDLQPIFRLSEGTVIGFEALSRGPRGSGLESAGALFEAAIKNKVLIELDRVCRRKAFLSAGRLPSNTKIFVNTLPATMRDPQFRNQPLIAFLDAAHLTPERIVIEITEHLMIENYAIFRDTMAYFTDLGMAFAVDDVGAGYSGLELIAKLKPSYLKIDISLVRDVHVSPINRSIVRGLTELGHAIGAKVLGEGVQSSEEVRVLSEIGVDFGQGYHFARPSEGPEPTP